MSIAPSLESLDFLTVGRLVVLKKDLKYACMFGHPGCCNILNDSELTIHSDDILLVLAKHDDCRFLVLKNGQKLGYIHYTWVVEA